MNVAAKILGGLIMMAGSAYVVYWSTQTPWNLWNAFVTVVEGVVPALVFLIGLFVVWLEVDEMKIEKELKLEEAKAKRAKKK